MVLNRLPQEKRLITVIDRDTVSRLKRAYLSFSARGYISDAPRKDVPGMPGHRMIEHEEDDIRYMDVYLKSLGSHYSGGSTMMLYKGEVIWRMTYEGWCDKRALPTLKAALAKSYSKYEFNAGRGPAKFTHQELKYYNDAHGEFERFSSVETIEDESVVKGPPWKIDPDTVAQHECRGRLLVRVVD
ncbi:hypothetical protein KW800_00260 [Candidatus Parcubacteria bacterium]|nr:hypothetical protein [Candidatus Parcubacteria bacterium]